MSSEEEAIESIFDAEPVDLIKEREQWHRMSRPRSKEIVHGVQATPPLDIWLSEFDRFIMDDENFVFQTDEGTVHIPLGLVERMADFLRGGLE